MSKVKEFEMDDFQKSIIAIRYWLLAKEYYMALDAMEFAANTHVGLRKDGVTPEFAHQLAVATYVRTLYNGLIYPEESFAAMFLHDIVEDYDISVRTIANRFGERVARSVRLLSKKIDGVKKSIEMYYDEMSHDAIASIGKGADRIHNLPSMIDVFTLKGQKWYIEETNTYILPMIKQARRRFPQQEPLYENAKRMLQCQVTLIEALLKEKEK